MPVNWTAVAVASDNPNVWAALLAPAVGKMRDAFVSLLVPGFARMKSG